MAMLLPPGAMRPVPPGSSSRDFDLASDRRRVPPPRSDSLAFEHIFHREPSPPPDDLNADTNADANETDIDIRHLVLHNIRAASRSPSPTPPTSPPPSSHASPCPSSPPPHDHALPLPSPLPSPSALALPSPRSSRSSHSSHASLSLPSPRSPLPHTPRRAVSSASPSGPRPRPRPDSASARSSIDSPLLLPVSSPRAPVVTLPGSPRAQASSLPALTLPSPLSPLPLPPPPPPKSTAPGPVSVPNTPPATTTTSTKTPSSKTPSSSPPTSAPPSGSRGFRPMTPPASDSDSSSTSRAKQRATSVSSSSPPGSGKRRGFGGFAPPVADSSDEDEDGVYRGGKDIGMEKGMDRMPTVRRPHRARDDAFAARYYFAREKPLEEEGGVGPALGVYRPVRVVRGGKSKGAGEKEEVEERKVVDEDAAFERKAELDRAHLGPRDLSLNLTSTRSRDTNHTDAHAQTHAHDHDQDQNQDPSSPHPSDCSSCHSLKDYRIEPGEGSERLLTADEERVLDSDEDGGDEGVDASEDRDGDEDGDKDGDKDGSKATPSPRSAKTVNEDVAGASANVAAMPSRETTRDTANAVENDDFDFAGAMGDREVVLPPSGSLRASSSSRVLPPPVHDPRASSSREASSSKAVNKDVAGAVVDREFTMPTDQSVTAMPRPSLSSRTPTSAHGRSESAPSASTYSAPSTPGPANGTPSRSIDLRTEPVITTVTVVRPRERMLARAPPRAQSLVEVRPPRAGAGAGASGPRVQSAVIRDEPEVTLRGGEGMPQDRARASREGDSTAQEGEDMFAMREISLEMPDLTLSVPSGETTPDTASSTPSAYRRDSLEPPPGSPPPAPTSRSSFVSTPSMPTTPATPAALGPPPMDVLRNLSALDRALLLLDVDPDPDEEALPAYMLTPDVAHGEATVDRGPRRPYGAVRPPPTYESLGLRPPKVKKMKVKKNKQGGGVLRALFGTGLVEASAGAGTPEAGTAGTPDDGARRPGVVRRLFSGSGSSSSADLASGSSSAPGTPRMLTVSASTADMHMHGPHRHSIAGDGQDGLTSSEGADGEAPACPFPSTTPIPGRPLLRDGNVLVYPENFACPACQNTGFAHSDPRAACTACWARFGRPFHSLLARFFRPGGASAREAARLQRPLGARASAPPALDVWAAAVGGGVGVGVGVGLGVVDGNENEARRGGGGRMERAATRA